jgi:hypothetical protein
LRILAFELSAFPPLPAVTASGSPLTVARPSRNLTGFLVRERYAACCLRGARRLLSAFDDFDSGYVADGRKNVEKGRVFGRHDRVTAERCCADEIADIAGFLMAAIWSLLHVTGTQVHAEQETVVVGFWARVHALTIGIPDSEVYTLPALTIQA